MRFNSSRRARLTRAATAGILIDLVGHHDIRDLRDLRDLRDSVTVVVCDVANGATELGAEVGGAASESFGSS